MASDDSSGAVRLILKLLLSLVMLMVGAGGLLLSFCGAYIRLAAGPAQGSDGESLLAYGIPLILVGVVGLILLVRLLVRSGSTGSGEAQPSKEADSTDLPQ